MDYWNLVLWAAIALITTGGLWLAALTRPTRRARVGWTPEQPRDRR
jgi:hypothetical protein